MTKTQTLWPILIDVHCCCCNLHFFVCLSPRFQWKTGSFPPELSITPTKGYICPGMEVPFEVTFAPVELSEDIRYENLSCFVEGAPSPVTLTVTGSCAAASTSKEVSVWLNPSPIHYIEAATCYVAMSVFVFKMSGRFSFIFAHHYWFSFNNRM